MIRPTDPRGYYPESTWDLLTTIGMRPHFGLGGNGMGIAKDVFDRKHRVYALGKSLEEGPVGDFARQIPKSEVYMEAPRERIIHRFIELMNAEDINPAEARKRKDSAEKEKKNKSRQFKALLKKKHLTITLTDIHEQDQTDTWEKANTEEYEINLKLDKSKIRDMYKFSITDDSGRIVGLMGGHNEHDIRDKDGNGFVITSMKGQQEAHIYGMIGNILHQLHDTSAVIVTLLPLEKTYPRYYIYDKITWTLLEKIGFEAYFGLDGEVEKAAKFNNNEDDQNVGLLEEETKENILTRFANGFPSDKVFMLGSREDLVNNIAKWMDSEH
jgi:hypothetical protein